MEWINIPSPFFCLFLFLFCLFLFCLFLNKERGEVKKGTLIHNDEYKWNNIW